MPKAHGRRLAGLTIAVSVALLGLVATVRRRKRNSRSFFGVLLAIGGTLAAFGVVASLASAQDQKTTEPTTAELIHQLGDAEQADIAAEVLVARGESAVSDLTREASRGDDIAVRGWCIVCLREIGGEQIDAPLSELQNDGEQPELVRTWAAAARVQLADSTEQLLEFAKLIDEFPALDRPIGRRLVAKFSEGDKPDSAEDLLSAVVAVPQLQTSLAPAILAWGADSLAEAMTGARNRNVRHKATAYLGTMATGQYKSVAAAVIRAYTFDSKADTVPWEGGPLFLPALNWSKPDARALVGNLVAWHVWCEHHAESAQKLFLQRQIHNNLSSGRLSYPAGYRIRGFRVAGPEPWLRTFGRVCGRGKIEQMLKEQGLSDEPRYIQVLDQLD